MASETASGFAWTGAVVMARVPPIRRAMGVHTALMGLQRMGEPPSARINTGVGSNGWGTQRDGVRRPTVNEEHSARLDADHLVAEPANHDSAIPRSAW